ncbi:MAG: YifB family Mg chelatase-like AAA ATPase [Sarcina sp.]
MASSVKSFGVDGIEGYLVNIEIDTIYGQPSVSIVGMGDRAVKESKDRLEAAIINAGFDFPKMKIIINLSPSDINKRGSHFDLGMAISLLDCSSQLTCVNLNEYGFIGELSLSSELRPCSGVLSMAIECRENGIKKLIVPRDNFEEASLVSGIEIYCFDKLRDVTDFLENNESYKEQFCGKKIKRERLNRLDFKDVKGQNSAIEFIVAAAAGGHNILMAGSPGCGKSMIAKRIGGILPSLSEEEALEVTKIYSVSGFLKNRGSLITERPFRDPHHNASMNSLIGGGNFAMPGEISLAHNGVLFLDEIAEFNKKTLDSLRQPIEDGKVTIARVRNTHEFPARFMLVAAMNPCPCGYYGENRCKCSDYEVLKYRQKLSGPIMDRIDIQKYLNNVDIMDLAMDTKSESTESIKERVQKARNIQNERYKNIKGVSCNSQMTPELVKEYCVLNEESIKLLKQAYEKFKYSARSYDKFLKVARTFADMDGAENIEVNHVKKSLACRDIEKEQSTMMVVR